MARDPRASSLDEELARAGVPGGYRRVRPREGYEHDPVPTGGALLVCGPVDTGKTLLACSIAAAHVGSARVRFVGSADLMARMASTYGTGQTEESVLAPYLAADLLVLDDLGKEPTDARTLSRLYRLVNGRYEERRATIVTSQFGPSALAARLARHGDAETAEAIASRLSPARGWCSVVRTGGRP